MESPYSPHCFKKRQVESIFFSFFLISFLKMSLMIQKLFRKPQDSWQKSPNWLFENIVSGKVASTLYNWVEWIRTKVRIDIYSRVPNKRAARLLIFSDFSFLHALIRDYTIIKIPPKSFLHVYSDLQVYSFQYHNVQKYSRVRNSSTGTFINFWEIFPPILSYSSQYVY